jgi:two-component system nitrogen regulation response regulator GlnG
VRELESLLGQLVLNAHGANITAKDLPSYLSQPRALGKEHAPASPPVQETANSTCTGEFESLVTSLIESSSDQVYAEALEFMERHLIRRMLAGANGNQSAAARRLGITRGSLRFKMQQLGISVDSAVRVPTAN